MSYIGGGLRLSAIALYERTFVARGKAKQAEQAESGTETEAVAADDGRGEVDSAEPTVTEVGSVAFLSVANHDKPPLRKSGEAVAAADAAQPEVVMSWQEQGIYHG
jgi:hypothetical protein